MQIIAVKMFQLKQLKRRNLKKFRLEPGQFKYMIISYINIHLFSIYGINTNSQLTSCQLA